MARRIVLTDIVVSAATADRLVMEGWRFDHHLIEGVLSFVKFLYVKPDAIEVYETPSRGTVPVSIRLEMSPIFRAKSMLFGWASPDGGRIEETSRLGGILSSYLLMTFERLGYISYENDIEKRTIDDYPLAREYVSGRCRDVYHVDMPSIDIVVIPRTLWNTFRFDKACDAEYLSSEGIIAVPDRNWKSRNFEESLIVHEMIHVVQRAKGWLVEIKDIGLTNYELSQLAEAVILGRPLELVARDLEKDVRVLKRAKGILDQRFEYMTKYFQIPCEVNAFAEQFRFLSVDRGVPVDRIVDAVALRCFEKGGEMSSRDRELVSEMIYKSDDKIADSISEQDALTKPINMSS